MIDADGKLRIKTAPVFEKLLQPARYKAAYGGRGSGKSHFFAGLAVEDAATIKGTRIVCIREVQKTLKESAKRLIEDKIRQCGLEGEGENRFRIYEDRIVTPGDGVIIFMGMNNTTAESIKSLEGYSRAWVEEAQTLSQRSLDLLRPTIREKKSQIWFSWNPTRRSDPVDDLFRVHKPVHVVSAVVSTSWRDNPWWNKTLEDERLDCLANQADQYDHIWEGAYQSITSGAYYAASLTAARGSGRIGRFYPDPLMQYRCFWDIGGTGAKADHTVIWVAQFLGREINVLDYYEVQGQPLAAHVAWLRRQGYDDALQILPHDGAHHDKVYAVSYQSALEQAGFTVEVIPNQGRAAASIRIEAARRLFPRIRINEEPCAPGIDALGAYHSKRDEKRMVDLGPEHDWASHAADAFGLMCVAYEEPKFKGGRPDRPIKEGSWLSM
jgi:phage terminase large subunit